MSTNPDSVYPVGERFMPGGGAVVKAIEKCSGKESIIIGKPNPFIIDHICK